jgi:hypothetical protein
VIKHCVFGLAAASAVFLAGCAAETPPGQTAEAKNPCTGVAPATGTMIRKKEDCGGTSEASAANTKEMIEQIKNAQGMGRSPVAPAGR